MDNSKAQELIEKHRQGTLTPAEEAMLEGWYLKLADEQQEPGITPDELLRKKEAIWSSLPVNREIVRVLKLRHAIQRIAAAAIVIIALGSGLFYFQQKNNQKQTANQLIKSNIYPGGNKAFLTLANGKKISLTNAASGKIANQSGIVVTKTAKGQLVYTIASANTATGNPQENNTITTPNGGQWQVVLPDGTKVWLNAASSLTYPVSFTAQGNRKVELNGEAYFEVAKDKAHPFIVHTDKQDVRVLGTHFNINAYTDETSIKTTLLEGAVNVTATNLKTGAGNVTQQTLKPGEQAILTNGNIQKAAVGTRAAIAWKNAMFFFENDKLEDIMKRVARWYDVKVVYKNESARNELFSGRISRAEDVNQVLNVLMLTEAVKFKIEGREIIVIK